MLELGVKLALELGVEQVLELGVELALELGVGLALELGVGLALELGVKLVLLLVLRWRCHNEVLNQRGNIAYSEILVAVWESPSFYSAQL